MATKRLAMVLATVDAAMVKEKEGKWKIGSLLIVLTFQMVLGKKVDRSTQKEHAESRSRASVTSVSVLTNRG